MANTYETITNRILDLLDQGVTPWTPAWRHLPGLQPMNATNSRPYRGINRALLELAPYQETRWVTYKQAQQLGGNVRRGEKATPVIFWKWNEVEDTADNGDTVATRIPLLRGYNVFNVEQCDGLGLPQLASPETVVEPVDLADSIVANMPNRPQINHDSKDCPMYVPAIDTVSLPPKASFVSTARYYKSLFHELTHSAGAAHRLNRGGIAGFDHFGSDQYGREELVAEWGAAFLCGEAGIQHTEENSAAYLDNWKRTIRADVRLVVIAAAQAQKAADYILGR